MKQQMTFYSAEELAEYLRNVPEGVSILITVEYENEKEANEEGTDSHGRETN